MSALTPATSDWGSSQALSVAPSAVCVSTSNLSSGGQSARAAPVLCEHHRPPVVCRRHPCPALHLCRLYLEGFCPHDDAACRWGHTVLCADNWAALEAHHLQAVPERDLLWMARSLMLHTAPVSAEEYRRELALCPEYAANAKCSRPDCFRLHLCPQMVTDDCQSGDDCRWSHRLTEPDNLMVLLRLRCAELTEREVLSRLEGQPQSEKGTDVSSGLSDIGGSVATGTISSPTNSEEHRPANDQDQHTFRDNGKERTVDEDCNTNGTEIDITNGDGNGDGHACSGDCHTDTENRHTTTENMQSSPRDNSNDDQPSTKDKRCFPTDSTSSASSDHYPAEAGDSGEAISKLGQTSVRETSETHTVNLSVKDMKLKALTLDVCCDHFAPYECEYPECEDLHVCRFFVAGICPEGEEKCSTGHRLSAGVHNEKVLAQHGLGTLKEDDLFWALQAGYLARYPITDKERRFALQICRPYQKGSCTKEGCRRLHVCSKYVGGTCSDTYKCGLSHQLLSRRNASIIRLLGFNSFNHKKVLDTLNKKVDVDDILTELASMEPLGLSSLSMDELTAISPSQEQTSLTKDEENQVTSAFRVGCEVSSRGIEMTNETDGEVVLAKSTFGKDEQQGSCGVIDSTEESCVSTGSHCHQAKYANGGGESASQESQALLVEMSKNLARSQDEMMHKALFLDVCCDHFGPYECHYEKCEDLHVCRYFVAGICTEDQNTCSMGHNITTSLHNKRLLGQHGLQRFSEDNLLQALKAGYLARYPITDKERRFALQICQQYQKGSCRENKCCKLHVCRKYIRGGCISSRMCGLSHEITSQRNAAIIRHVGFKSFYPTGLLNILKNPVDIDDILDELASMEPLDISSHWTSDPTDESSLQEQVSLMQLSETGEHHLDRITVPSNVTSRDQLVDPYCPSEHSAGTTSSQVLKSDIIDSPCCLTSAPTPDHASADESISGETASDELSTQDGVPGMLSGQDELFTSEPLTNRPAATDAVQNLLPGLCAFHSSGNRCEQAGCVGFHVCGFFMAGLCRRPDESCPLGHTFETEHNVRVMQQHGLVGGSAETFQSMLDDIALNTRVTFSNGAHEKVLLCLPYNSRKGCVEGGNCQRFHVCNRFLAGTCAEQDCGLRHCLTGEHNERVREFLGLRSSDAGSNVVWASDEDLLELLRAKLGTRPGVYAKPDTETEVLHPVVSGFIPVENMLVPPVCRRHGAGFGCTDGECLAVHICPHFLASACRRQICSLGHCLNTEHNRKALRLGDRTLTKEESIALVDILYSETPHIRNKKVYSKLRLCTCKRSPNGSKGENCTDICICHSFLAGSCKQKSCVNGHELMTTVNKRKLESLGLKDASSDEVLEMIRAIYNCRSVHLNSE